MPLATAPGGESEDTDFCSGSAIDLLEISLSKFYFSHHRYPMLISIPRPCALVVEIMGPDAKLCIQILSFTWELGDLL